MRNQLPAAKTNASRIPRISKNYATISRYCSLPPAKATRTCSMRSDFLFPIRLFFFNIRTPSFAVMSDLEIDRAKKQAHVDRVFRFRCTRKNYASSARRRRHHRHTRFNFPRTRHSLARRAGEFFRFALGSAPRQGLQRANQARPFLGRARDQKSPRSETDRRIFARRPARARGRHSHAQTHPEPSAMAICT